MQLRPLNSMHELDLFKEVANKTHAHTHTHKDRR